MTEYQIFVIRLLVAILGRLIFPHAIMSRERDREHQLLVSDAVKMFDNRKASAAPVNNCNPVNGVHASFCTGHGSEKEL